MNLAEIDSAVQRLTQQFAALVNVLNVKSNLEKDKVFSLKDVATSKAEAQKIISEYKFDEVEFMLKISNDSIQDGWQTRENADKIAEIFFSKFSKKLAENLNFLISKHIRNAKDMAIRNKVNRNPKLFKYTHDTIVDAAQRKISLIDKFRKDIRKVFIDFYNDSLLFGAYNLGKSWAYTLTPTGEVYKRFLIGEYIKTGLKDKIFHPNAQSLAYVED